MGQAFRMSAWCVCAMALSGVCARAQVPADAVRDLSLLVSRDRPCVWPSGMTPFAVVPTATFNRAGRHRDMLVIDEHTGTQWDAPAHFVPPPGSGLPGAGPMGLVTGEKVPAWQFCGEACVVDVSAYRDKAEPGKSYLIGKEPLLAWESANRKLGPGDVVLFRSGYTDAYYKPFPLGDRFVTAALRKQAPGWPAPTPEVMEFLGERGVMTLGLDGASMGPLPDLAVATHQAGGKRGMIWVECATNLGGLPPTGAFFALLAAKHAGGSGGECRCVAITDKAIATELVARSRAKTVVDLSVTLHEDYPVVWPGRGPGEEGGRYVGKVLNAFSPTRGPFFALAHMFDSHAGTHLVMPSFALPDAVDRGTTALAPVAGWREEFERKWGKLPEAVEFTEKAPLERLMGRAHVVDARPLRGKVKAEPGRPAGAVISREFLEEHARSKPFKAGEVVVFRSGFSDEFFRPLPAAPDKDALFVKPLEGESEGWPALSAEAVAYLAEAGVRCLGTDGPTLGGVDAKSSQFTDWMAASKGMLVVEFLTNLGSIDGKDAFFIFAPVKIEGTRGGYGRALALVK